ncbi:PepSY-like domain-containing protein [Akkermansia muciniphila]|uniref:PepSY-like domain-containing protein n=1 Tax=Akkermansia muciniphila TaxID=239935 RepID=UPI001BFEECE7|nr:PepSY-like domain-containing protein [Akkermansia muciniphila]MBT8778378.1 hypothetical protein [Akkermansia muciniphila]
MNISRMLAATLAAAFTLPALADIPASRVPAPVKEQVQKQYPNAGAIEWDFDNDEDIYEAEFRLNGLEYEVKLYPDGTVCLVKADISLQNLPAPVTAAIARDFPGYAPRRAKQITARGALKYRVDCRSETAAVRKLELYYAADGKLLSQKADD